LEYAGGGGGIGLAVVTRHTLPPEPTDRYPNAPGRAIQFVAIGEAMNAAIVVTSDGPTMFDDAP
jgi:hypothetical protein